jgi:cytochrome P450
MTESLALDRERIRNLFDLRRRGGGAFGKYTNDPNPTYHEMREAGPVVEGTMHGLLGYEGDDLTFQGLPEPDRRHFTAFDYATCDEVFRDEDRFHPQAGDIDRSEAAINTSMLTMVGEEHRRYRALVQPSFVPAKAKWWIANWIEETVRLLIDGFESEGRADLNVDFCAAIPILTITGSFGLSPDQALDVRESFEGAGGGPVLNELLMPIIADRRSNPKDDLISVLCQAEITDEDGELHVLSDLEILTFSHLLLGAGGGTTWKQMGITLAALLNTPGALDAVREDRSLLRGAIEESVRWSPTDPMFARYAVVDTNLAGVDIPAGSVVYACFGAANRDPARWDDPDTYDVRRPIRPTLAFGSGPHICLGMHVARAELTTAVGALIERLPNLRLDPEAEPPQIIGMYERGPTEVPVLWG